jgi:hypothetical protein
MPQIINMVNLKKYILFTLLCGFSIGALAQADSLEMLEKPPKVRPNDTEVLQKDSMTFSHIKSRMYRTKAGKALYAVFFKDVYNATAKVQVSAIEANPFVAFEGKIIRSLAAKRLNVFGYSVYDTTRRARNVVEKLGNKLHQSTHEGVILRNFVDFEVGDALNATLMQNTERLLRQQQFCHDARIYVSEAKDVVNQVDVLIVTQDTWPLMPTISVSNASKYAVRLDHYNLGGSAHQLAVGLRHWKASPLQENDIFGSYTIPYLGKSLTTAQANVLYTGEEKSANVRVFKPFLTTQTKYAGAVELGYFRNQIRDKPRGVDSTFYYPVNRFLSDAWLGRAFQKSRIVLAARARKLTFTQRPTLSADSNQTYQNRRSLLVNIGFSNRTYRRDVLIYGFGRTEDVPEGYLGSLVLGAENAELGQRHYLGLKMAKGRYLSQNLGYLYSVINAGSFIKNKKAEQGLLGYQGYYYSPLMTAGPNKVRQFVNFNYAKGFNRFNTVEERINISNEGGIRGVRSDSLQGVKKLVVNLETVLFSPASLAGFRIAPYLFGDFGLVSYNDKKLVTSPIYSGFGIGFRFRNENLTFNTFQIRLGIYPNIPNIGTYRLAFGGEQSLRLKDFDISAPAELEFR